MRLPLPYQQHRQQRAPDRETSSMLGMVYGCELEGCGRLALQSCMHCGQRFCTQHIQAWERDLPARGLKLYTPDWYCYQCRSRV